MIDLSDDPARLDVARVHGWLASSYWSRGVALRQVELQIANSLCVGAYGGEAQIGFARAITDYASFAWIDDVWVDEPHRGRGVGRRLVRFLLDHPRLSDVRRFALVTADAHGVYETLGFHTPLRPQRWMEYLTPDFAARVKASPQ